MPDMDAMHLKPLAGIIEGRLIIVAHEQGLIYQQNVDVGRGPPEIDSNCGRTTIHLRRGDAGSLPP